MVVVVGDGVIRWMFAASLALGILFLVRLGIVFREIQRNRRTHRLFPDRSSDNSNNNTNSSNNKKNKDPLSVLVVLGSGGHTTELLFMMQKLNIHHYHPIAYCKASTDTTSQDRLRTTRNNNNNTRNSEIIVYNLPRSREVGQSYISSAFSTLYAGWFALSLVGKLRPHVILCNGPGTCIPVCWAALLFRICLGRSSTTVFIESYCRVQSLSLTGKILYYLADLFVVHWPELHVKYPNSVVTKTFIR